MTPLTYIQKSISYDPPRNNICLDPSVINNFQQRGVRKKSKMVYVHNLWNQIFFGHKNAYIFLQEYYYCSSFPLYLLIGHILMPCYIITLFMIFLSVLGQDFPLFTKRWYGHHSTRCTSTSKPIVYMLNIAYPVKFSFSSNSVQHFGIHA